MHGGFLLVILELGRIALVLGATSGLAGLVARAAGSGPQIQPWIFALAAVVAVPYALGALVSSRNPARFRWRKRGAWLGAGLGLVAAVGLALAGLAPVVALAAPVVALGVTLAVERMR